MCITKIEAFKHADGTIFQNERDAVRHGIKAVLPDIGDESLKALMLNASSLVPLMQRWLALAPPKSPTATPTEVTSEKRTGEPMAHYGNPPSQGSGES